MINLSWELIYPIAAAVLGLAIAYGLFRYSRRNRRNDAITEQATREEYHHPKRYDRTEEEFRDKVRPS
ncbi:MAG: hypothetical protein Q7V15_02355 [Phenylobacterium sp.]|uniref:hypothetical protein n=1 Tax=Phenylobacterium sp. TaxID=1871053 RepID=UPI002719BC2A|nr:hypothetical protein [Phenylobacterium sp.]MDO8900174.1 hypothetical protein [Phenylobacterium sp.]MDP2212892.1 hypothetical protein [Phenylobacterium sp.]